MKRSDGIIYVLLAITALVSRAPLIEKYQSHWDGPQYSIATVAFSYVQQTPAPPGYPLYIALGSVINSFTNNPHLAILSISVLASIASVTVLYFVGKSFFNKYVGIIAALIYLTGSTFYYFGLTAYGYGLLPPLTLLLGYVVYQIFIKQKQLGLLLGIIFGIFFGIRPQESIQIGPLFLLGFSFLTTKQKLVALFVVVCITLAWFIPIVGMSGGFQEFITINIAAAKAAFPDYSVARTSELMLKGFLLSFGLASAFLLYYVVHLFRRKNIDKRIVFFYAIWIIPGIYYNLFVRTEHAGYQMSYLTAFLLLISYAIWKSTHTSKLLFSLSLIIVTFFNLFWFVYDRDPQFVKPYRPTSFHYSDIRKNDLKVGSKVVYVQENFNPESTLLITSDTLWRPYMYHLRDFKLIAFGGLITDDTPFAYNQFDAQNWKMKETNNAKQTIVVPANIKYIVFLDDEAKEWVKNNESKITKLPGNSSLTVIENSSESILRFKKFSVTLEKKS